MLKITSVIVGALATLSIAQPSLAMGDAGQAKSIVAQPQDNLHAQVIIKLGNSGDRYDRYRYDRYRYERERERERWEAKRRRFYERRYGDRYDRYERHDRY